LLIGEGVKPIKITGEVVRCDVQEFGCIIAGIFSPLSSHEKDGLKKFIHEYKN